MQILCGLNQKTGEIIYSRAQHDYITDSEGNGMDGGQVGSYYRVNGGLKIIVIELDVNTGTLFDDWNYNRNNYGRISPEEAKNVKIIPQEDQVDRNSFEFKKSTATWGTYGINGDQPRQEKNLILCDTNHLKAILRTQPHASQETKEIIKSILQDRGIAS